MPFVLVPAAPGTCLECAAIHHPNDPHNAQSLFYQYRFYSIYGRWPTWDDALSHCPDKIKEIWRRELSALGITLQSANAEKQQPMNDPREEHQHKKKKTRKK